MRGITEPKVLDEQGAFRKKRSCADQLFTVRTLGEKIIAKNKRKLKGLCLLWQTTTEHSKLDTHARCTQVNRLHKAAWVGTVQKRLVLYLPLRYHTRTWFSGEET